MKKRLTPLALFGILLTALVLFPGCTGVYIGDDYGFDSGGSGNGGGGSGGGGGYGNFSDGSLTFSDGVPAGLLWAIYVTPDTVSSSADGVLAMLHAVATGGPLTGITSNNKVYLFADNYRTFNKNDSYTVVFYDVHSDDLKYKSSVQFSEGNATISYSSMTTVS